MNGYDVEFTEAAAADFKRICEWYAAQSLPAEAK